MHGTFYKRKVNRAYDGGHIPTGIISSYCFVDLVLNQSVNTSLGKVRLFLVNILCPETVCTMYLAIECRGCGWVCRFTLRAVNRDMTTACPSTREQYGKVESRVDARDDASHWRS